MHRILHDALSAIDLIDQCDAGREDSHPENVRLSEEQADDTQNDQNWALQPQRLSIVLSVKEEPVQDQDRQRRHDVRVVQCREEEQGREEQDVKGASPTVCAASDSVDLDSDGRYGQQSKEVLYAEHREIATREERDEVGDEVEARRRCDLGVPGLEMAIAVGFCLTDVEDFVLGELSARFWECIAV